MKFGVRTPSIKKSISARTTGRVKRAVKSSVNPTYSKKGMGIINNPKKSIYNNVYNKTTFSALDISNKNNKSGTNEEAYINSGYNYDIEQQKALFLKYNKVGARNKWISLTLCLFLGYFGAHKFYEGNTERGILYLFTFGLFGIGIIIDTINILCKPTIY